MAKGGITHEDVRSSALAPARKHGQAAPMKGFPDLPPLWLAGFMVIAWLCARFVPLATVDADLARSLGVVMAGAGVALIFWSAFWFWQKRTTIEPHHTPGTLIVEGPYRISRNPIYLGMVGILAGQVIWMGALVPLVFPPLLLAVLTIRFAKPEEAALRDTFGEAAQAYLAATRRWL